MLPARIDLNATLPPRRADGIPKIFRIFDATCRRQGGLGAIIFEKILT